MAEAGLSIIVLHPATVPTRAPAGRNSVLVLRTRTSRRAAAWKIGWVMSATRTRNGFLTPPRLIAGLRRRGHYQSLAMAPTLGMRVWASSMVPARRTLI